MPETQNLAARRGRRGRILTALAVAGALALAEAWCVWMAWLGPDHVCVSIEPAAPGSVSSTNSAWNCFAATNAPIRSVLEALNPTCGAILDEGLFPAERVNVRVSWNGWRRRRHAFPEVDPVMRRVLEACEEKYGISLVPLTLPVASYALARTPGAPLRLEASTATSYSFSSNTSEWKGITTMTELAKLAGTRLGIDALRDDTGLRGKYVVHFLFAGDDPGLLVEALANAGLTITTQHENRDFLVFRPVAIDGGGNVIAKELPVSGVTIEPTRLQYAPMLHAEWNSWSQTAYGHAVDPLRFLGIFPQGRNGFVDHAGLTNQLYSIQVEGRKMLARDRLQQQGPDLLWKQTLRAYEAYFHVTIQDEERNGSRVWVIDRNNP